MQLGAITGHCLCGAVTLTVSGLHDPSPGACHCRMCQRWSGAVFLAFDVQSDALTVKGPVAIYASSSFAERAFCSVCGSHLWLRDTGVDETTHELMPGLFDEARDWPLRSEVYSDRAMASVRLGGDHRRTTQADYEMKNLFVEGNAP